MVKVMLWGSLASFVDDRAELEIKARNIRQLLERLAMDHPSLKPALAKGVSVSIDGLIYNDAWFQEIGDKSEVCILPRIEGG
jgi:sulfur-carrier protein